MYHQLEKISERRRKEAESPQTESSSSAFSLNWCTHDVSAILNRAAKSGEGSAAAEARYTFKLLQAFCDRAHREKAQLWKEDNLLSDIFYGVVDISAKLLDLFDDIDGEKSEGHAFNMASQRFLSKLLVAVEGAAFVRLAAQLTCDETEFCDQLFDKLVHGRSRGSNETLEDDEGDLMLWRLECPTRATLLRQAR